MGEQLADTVQVAIPDLVADEGIGRVQHQAVVAHVGLQGLEPGMHVLGRELGLQAFQTAGPGVHR